MEPVTLQPYLDRATKAQTTILELKNKIASLEAIIYTNNNIRNVEQADNKTDNETNTKSKNMEEFLQNRPKPHEVGINPNVSSTLYSTIRHLEHEQRKDSINQSIERRPSQEDLKNAGIVGYTELAPSLHATAHSLEKEITKDKLQKKVDNRPSPEDVGVNVNLSPNLAKVSHELEKQQMKDKFSAAFAEAGGIHAYHDNPSVAPYSNIAPSLQATAAQINLHQRRKSLDKLLQIHLQKEKQDVIEEESDKNDETQNPPVNTTTFIVQHLKEIREEVLKLGLENKHLQEGVICRDSLLKDFRRSLHWCIKIGNLKKSLEFFSNVFGMKVLRHEEFAVQCDAKCNGDYNNPWSKTMIGYGDERTNFALELTYNYGFKGYRRGNDLRYIGIYIVEESLQKAEKLGYHTKKLENQDHDSTYEIIGPDDVCIHAKVVKQLPREPFWSVALNVKSIAQTFDYWVGTLNLHTLSYVESFYLSCAYGHQVQMEFYQLKNNEQLDHGKAQGRIAFTTRIANGPSFIHTYINDRGYKIHTKPVTLPTPGKADVTVVILQDPNDYEICFVGEEGFDDLCVTKPGDENIDWKKREENGADQNKGKIDA